MTFQRHTAPRPVPFSRRIKRFFSDISVISVVALIGIPTVAGIGAYSYLQESSHPNCVISTTETAYNPSKRVVEGRVHTENCGTFNLGADWLRGRMNVDEEFQELANGDVYTFTTTGLNIPFLQAYPNIIQADQVHTIQQ